MNILLKSAKIIDPGSDHHSKIQDILIENGVISKIADSIPESKNTNTVNFQNLHVSPGWFDSSVCFGEPGYEDRETIENGLETAALSGFTAVALNPNTNPVIDSNTDITFLIDRSRGKATKVYPVGALTINSEGVDLAELYDMKRAGAVAFGDYQKAVSNPNLLKIALLYAQNFGALVLSFPNEVKISGKGVVNESENTIKLGLKGIPALAEELHVARDLYILEYTGGKLHIPTISTATSVKLIREAKSKGLDVSCSVAVHNLALTDEMLSEFDTNYKVMPPLRSESDCKALREAVLDGTIDFVTSDHNPLDTENKNLEFDLAKYGTTGLESAFGTLNKLFGTDTAISLLTKGRERFAIESSPTIKTGEKAELTLFNPEGKWKFESGDIRSTSKNSAFIGAELLGQVYGIIANDKIRTVNK